MRTLLAILAALVFPSLAAGQTVCGAPVTRYLDMLATKILRSSTIQNLHTYSTVFVFSDGSYLSSALNGTSFRDEQPFAPARGAITHASSSPGRLEDLRRAVNAAHLGLQKSCVLVRNAGEESYRLKWYGRNGRTNDFILSSEGGGPVCSPEVVAFLNLLLDYTSATGPQVERFVTPQ